MNNPHRIQEMGQLSYQIIQRFSPSQVAIEMLKGFKKVLYENRQIK